MARNVKSAFDGIVAREMHREMHLHLGENMAGHGPGWPWPVMGYFTVEPYP